MSFIESGEIISSSNNNIIDSYGKNDNIIDLDKEVKKEIDVSNLIRYRDFFNENEIYKLCINNYQLNKRENYVKKEFDRKDLKYDKADDYRRDKYDKPYDKYDSNRSDRYDYKASHTSTSINPERLLHLDKYPRERSKSPKYDDYRDRERNTDRDKYNYNDNNNNRYNNRYDNFNTRNDMKYLILPEEVEVFSNLQQPLGMLIEKEYKLNNFEEWKIPDASTLFTYDNIDVPYLLNAKVELNSIKSQLDSVSLDLWNAHVKKTNLVGNVVSAVSSRAQPQLCTIAWCKIYEILYAYKLCDTSNGFEGEKRSLHLCEAPGAFVCATNHYIRSEKNEKWDWRAVSLNPYFEGNDLKFMIDDDRFIKNSMSNWIFGPTDSGNIMLESTIHCIWNTYGSLTDDNEKGPFLITADGAIDCDNNPEEQERMVSHLLYCEMVAALGCLRKGGNFVIKMFTFFEHSSYEIVYFMSCVFEQACSKSGNSETYVVGRCFRGISREIKFALLSFVEKRLNKGLIPLPDSFMKQAFVFSDLFSKCTGQVILRAINLLQSTNKEINRFKDDKRNAASKYIERFNVKAIESSYNLVPYLPPREGYIIQGREVKKESLEQRRQKVSSDNTINIVEEVSFGQKLVSKMGHVAGQGLGKLGQGITSAITATMPNAREGLGYNVGIDGIGINFKTNVLDYLPNESDIVLAEPIKSITISKFLDNELHSKVRGFKSSFLNISNPNLKSLPLNTKTLSYTPYSIFWEYAQLDFTSQFIDYYDADKILTHLDFGMGQLSFFLHSCISFHVRSLVVLPNNSNIVQMLEEQKVKMLPFCHTDTIELFSGSVTNYEHVFKMLKESKYTINILSGDIFLDYNSLDIHAEIFNHTIINPPLSDDDLMLMRFRHKKLLSLLLILFEFLEDDGTFLCRIPSCLSRALASCLFLLNCCFSTVRIDKTKWNPFSTDVFVICQGFKKPLTPVFKNLIEATLQKLGQHNEFDLMSFVPINYLTESLFYKYILNMNDDFYKNILASLQQIEKTSSITDVRELIRSNIGIPSIFPDFSFTLDQMKNNYRTYIERSMDNKVSQLPIKILVLENEVYKYANNTYELLPIKPFCSRGTILIGYLSPSILLISEVLLYYGYDKIDFEIIVKLYPKLMVVEKDNIKYISVRI